MFGNAEILRKYIKLWLDTSIYAEFYAGVDSDGENPSKICKKLQNHAEITKFRFDHMNLNTFSRGFPKSLSQYEKLAPNVEKSMISKCHFFSRRMYYNEIDTKTIGIHRSLDAPPPKNVWIPSKGVTLRKVAALCKFPYDLFTFALTLP